MEHVSEKRFPLNDEDYKLYEEIGDGVNATVYRALCIPLNKEVAIKVLDLEKCNNDLDGIRREVQTMTLTNHPNVLRSHCSFTTGHNLWVVMPYMSGGSCLHIMKSSYAEGFEEPVIATLLREVLKALVYLHGHGHIHRDVKGGNILVDCKGTVKLADFGVSACMFDAGDRQRSRNTFVGTPCWMAPEVMQQLHGYDFKADIWSFGITALELAHGHAPFSKYPPMKVLLMTLQNAPPGLDYERDKRFPKSFREMVAACLVKDPKKRPSSEKLLRHPFFKHARSSEYLSQTILDGVAPLGDRFRMLKAKEADLLVQNKALYEDKEQLSQKEYIRGISAWNFNLEDLRSQAALIQDDGMPNAEEPQMDKKQKGMFDDVGTPAEGPSSVATNHSYTEPILGKEDGFNDVQDLESSPAPFPAKPLQALKGHLAICENSVNNSALGDSDHDDGRNENNIPGTNSSLRQNAIAEHIKLGGSLLPDGCFSTKKFIPDGDRDYLQQKCYFEGNNCPLLYQQERDTNSLSSVDDASEASVQRKGRFKVTSADLSPKGPLNCAFGPVCGGLSSPPEQNLPSTSTLASLQCILQQNIMQREEIIKVMKYAEQSCGRNIEPVEAGVADLSQISPTTTRERELHSQVFQLQQSIASLVEELRRQKMKSSQLEKQLDLTGKGNGMEK